MSALLEVGLTGGIASGKSRVLARLAAGGCHVLDLDRVAHELMKPTGSAYRDVVEAFGRGTLDEHGRIDRRRLGAVVFADAAARARLESIVHPRIRAEERRRADELRAGEGGVLVTDAALLVETGSHLRFDRLVVVDVPPDEQRRRLIARDGLDDASARARIDAQMPVAEKRRFGHFVIDTASSLEQSAAAADVLASELRALAAAPVVRPPLEEHRLAAALASGTRGDQGGLTPLALAESIPRNDGIELRELARLRSGGGEGPWFATGAKGSDGGQTFAAVLAAWGTARRGVDAPFLAAACWALSRLLGAGAAAAGEAGLLTLVAAGGLRGGLESAFREHGDAWRAELERWCGVRPELPAALRAALAEPERAGAARAAAGGGAAGESAAALVALSHGRGDREPDGREREAAAALCRWAVRRRR